MPVPHRPLRNALLATLPEDVRQRLNTKLELVSMHAGTDLLEPGVPMCDVYFPVSAVVAISATMENGSAAEVALVGREGVVGLRLLLGAASLNVRARVQSSGLGYKLPVRYLVEEMGRSGALLQALLQYTAVYIGQIVQSAACNRHATVEQRLCRWLLLSLDRMPANELTMTHESIAGALGAKREGITEAAGRLRREGAISYRRGRIEVLDRSVLESRACEFYVSAGHGAGHYELAGVPTMMRLPDRSAREHG